MYRWKESYCTIVLVAINVLIFIVLSFVIDTEDGAAMMQYGAMYAPQIVEEQAYYQLFTSMFLHFGFPHLLNNMVMLLLLGANVEPELGHVKYVILYLLSGIGGGILSAYVSMQTGMYYVGAGASGAIFGIIGAALHLAIANGGSFGYIRGNGVVFMLLYSLYYGYTSEGVDNRAHIGGFVTGFILAFLLYRKKEPKRSTFSW